MKFIVSSNDLLKLAQQLNGIINNNNTLAILDNFLFEITPNELTIRASDLETTVSSKINVETTETGAFAISAKLLLDILKTLPPQPLTFLTLENGTLEISSDQGKYDMAFFDGNDFPKQGEIENTTSTNIVAEVLSTALSKTIFATGNDDLRPAIGGVFFDFTNKELNFVATDAHKLVRYTREDINAEIEESFIIPKKPLTVLKNMLTETESEVTIDFNESSANFSFDNTNVACRLVDGKFPNYKAAIPTENPNVLTVDRQAFLNVVRRVSIFANKTTYKVQLKMAGTELLISSEDIDFSNKAEERMTCDYHGDDMTIAFNSKFLIEMLNNLESENISIAMSSPQKAGILEPIDGVDKGEIITMVVMPVTVK